jgi:serine/threonine-protein kinase/endoribonuclease IRE1
MDKSIKIGKITYFSEKIIGTGFGGSFVYEGLYEEKDKVAVKLCSITQFKLSIKEVDTMRQLEHYNVIRYYCTEKDDNFFYIAMAYADTTLANYLKQIDPGDFSNRRSELISILKQTASGLSHLHLNGIIHRSITPNNILICVSGEKVLPKISDFGLSKILDENADYSSIPENMGYIAREYLLKPRNLVKPKAMDVFALGCVFHFILTHGKHPFGEDVSSRDHFIKLGSFMMDKSLDYLSYILIESMIDIDPDSRPKIGNVIKFPLFWKPIDHFDFLVKTYNKNKGKVNFINRLTKLSLSEKTDKFYAFDVDTLKKLMNGRIYNRTSIYQLLKMLRNVHQHFETSKDLKKRFHSKEELWKYLEPKSGNLFFKCYFIMQNFRQDEEFEDCYDNNGNFYFYKPQSIKFIYS